MAFLDIPVDLVSVRCLWRGDARMTAVRCTPATFTTLLRPTLSRKCIYIPNPFFPGLSNQTSQTERHPCPVSRVLRQKRQRASVCAVDPSSTTGRHEANRAALVGGLQGNHRCPINNSGDSAAHTPDLRSILQSVHHALSTTSQRFRGRSGKEVMSARASSLDVHSSMILEDCGC